MTGFASAAVQKFRVFDKRSGIRFAVPARRAKANTAFLIQETSPMAGTVAAIVVGAGRGLRAGGNGPKQYREIAGQPAIRPSLSVFAEHPGDRKSTRLNSSH